MTGAFTEVDVYGIPFDVVLRPGSIRLTVARAWRSGACTDQPPPEG